jgi:DNA invertase Pin-like site-specific DNA recombinase
MDNSKTQNELAILKNLPICSEFRIIDQIIEIGGSYNTLISKRNKIKRLLNVVRTEKVDAVICKNLNNLTRYPLEQIAVEQGLMMNNCRLISAELDTPASDEKDELWSALEKFYFLRKEEHSC